MTGNPEIRKVPNFHSVHLPGGTPQSYKLCTADCASKMFGFFAQKSLNYSTIKIIIFRHKKKLFQTLILNRYCSWRRDASIHHNFLCRRWFFGKVMRKTSWQKFHHTIRHTHLKAANLRFVPGNYFRKRTIRFSIEIVLFARAPHTKCDFTIEIFEPSWTRTWSW
jgi:hypothetical protein